MAIVKAVIGLEKFLKKNYSRAKIYLKGTS